MKFRPCIDLHGGRVKQIVGGTLRDGTKGKNGSAQENFVSDKEASWYASLYKEKGLTGGHVIMLGPGNEEAAKAALKAWPGGLQIGGGINDENALSWIEAGASHVIVTSALFNGTELNSNELEKISKTVGKDRLVLDLSCRRQGNDWIVVTDRWQTFTNFKLTVENIRNLSDYCNEFLIHGVDVEGKRCGIEENLVSLLGTTRTLPITYAGGISSLRDVEKIGRLGQNKIDFTVGSALNIFGGNLDLETVLGKIDLTGHL
jgi:phosphoribosylformimino-5-aminoimidazole carboxamide ribotide isomerase